MKTNLDPIHWLAIALLGGSTILGLCLWYTSDCLDDVRAEYADYQLRVMSEAKAATLANEQALSFMSQQMSKLNGELENAKSDLDHSYAEYDRLRRQPKTTRPATVAPNLSETTRDLACNQTDESKFPRSMERLEDGIISRLVKSRDEVILLLNTCLKYAQSVPTK